MKKASKLPKMGAVISAAGLVLRAVLLILTSAGVEGASGTLATAVMLCLLCGGFAVYAYESRGVRCIFAEAAAVAFPACAFAAVNADSAASVLAARILYVCAMAFAILSVFSIKDKRIAVCTAAGLALTLVCALCVFRIIPATPAVFDLVSAASYLSCAAGLIFPR